MKVEEEIEKPGLKLNIQKMKIMASGPITSWQIDRETMETLADFTFFSSKITADGDCSHEIKRHLFLGRKEMTNWYSIFKKHRYYIADKGPYIQSYGFSTSHVLLWEMDNEKVSTEESMPLNSVQEKTLQSLLDFKVIKPVNPKGNRPWIIIKRTDAEAPILWPPDAKSQLIGKDLDPGKDWRQVEKWMTEDEMVGWYQWLNGREFEQTLGDGEGQGNLACCSPWCRKESDVTEQLNNQTIYLIIFISMNIHLFSYTSI